MLWLNTMVHKRDYTTVYDERVHGDHIDELEAMLEERGADDEDLLEWITDIATALPYVEPASPYYENHTGRVDRAARRRIARAESKGIFKV